MIGFRTTDGAEHGSLNGCGSNGYVAVTYKDGFTWTTRASRSGVNQGDADLCRPCHSCCHFSATTSHICASPAAHMPPPPCTWLHQLVSSIPFTFMHTFAGATTAYGKVKFAESTLSAASESARCDAGHPLSRARTRDVTCSGCGHSRRKDVPMACTRCRVVFCSECVDSRGQYIRRDAGE